MQDRKARAAKKLRVGNSAAVPEPWARAVQAPSTAPRPFYGTPAQDKTKRQSQQKTKNKKAKSINKKASQSQTLSSALRRRAESTRVGAMAERAPRR
eukprot:102626-Rhodomonas_salina.1